MMSHAPASTLPALPTHTPVRICTACTEGDHEQVSLTESCACSCHGTKRLIANAEIAA
jgi:hypothetical protein